MLLLRDIHLRLGGRLIYEGLEAAIGPRDRIGLVGPNGAGKTTLLRVLLGEQAIDQGRIEKASWITLGYLPQDGAHARGRTVFAEVEAGAAGLVALRERIEAASERLSALNGDEPEAIELIEQIGGWEHEMEDLDASRLPSRIASLLDGLGFAPEDRDRDAGEFSGGWQMRIALARLLLQQPSLLLLDEPTNHLDLPSLRWLENFLCRYEGSLLIVSHDRAFLDRVTTRTFALRQRAIDAYAGNYSFFERESAARRAQMEQAAKAQERELERQKEFIDRFRYKASKAAQVQSRIKALDRIERIELEEDEASIAFSFPPAPRSGDRVLTVRGASKSYGAREVFRGVDLELMRGERVAIVGANGQGKSTLVRLIAGREPATAGSCSLGHGVVASYFAQHQADELDPNLTVLGTIEAVAEPGSRTRLRTILGSFLFRGDDVDKPVRVLSGGERSRLALARMLVQPFNLLILDEPTNHLDMPSIAKMAEALTRFGGTVLVVSHEQAFLEPLVTKVWEVGAGTVRVYPGRFGEYLAHLDARSAAPAKQRAAAAPAPARASPEPSEGRETRQARASRRSELAPLRKELEALERRIAALEDEQRRLEAAALDPAFFRRGPATAGDLRRLDEIKAELATALARWETLGERLAEA